MNDNHLDPPEYREPPEWYYRLWEYLETEQPPESVAVAIRQAMQMWTDLMNQEYDPGPELIEEHLPDVYYGGPEHCPHGIDWSNCDACYHAGDIAYDAAREGGR